MINITEAELVLKYALHIPATERSIIDSETSEDIAKWLDDAYARVTETNCNPFIGNRRFLYFRAKEDTKETAQIDYAALTSDNDFWKHVFKQEAILNTYTIIRRLISEYSNLSVNKIIPGLLPHGPSGFYNHSESIYGLSYLLSHKNSYGESLATLTPDCELSFFSRPRLSLTDNIHISKKYPHVPSRLDLCNDRLIKEFKRIAKQNKKNADMLYEELKEETKLETLEDILYQTYKQSDLMFYKNRATSAVKITSKVVNIDNISTDSKPSADYRTLLSLHNLEIYQLMSKVDTNKTPILKAILKPQFTNPEKGNIAYNSSTHEKMAAQYNKIKKDLQLPGIFNEEYVEAPDISSLSNANETPGVYFDLADKVYARYLMEKYYSIELIDELYTIINKSPHSDVLINMVDLVSECSLLPNAFTRQYLLQAVTDNLSYKNLRGLDFGDSPIRTVLMHDKTADLQTDHEKLTYWKKSYTDLIRSLKNYIFPVFNSCFFVTVWKDVRSTTTTDKECAEKLFRLLTEYLNSKDQVSKLLSVKDFYSDTSKAPLKEYPLGPVLPFKYGLTGSEKIDLKLYLRCADAVSSKKRESEDAPLLIDSEYIEKIYLESNDHPQNSFYRAAKAHI